MAGCGIAVLAGASAAVAAEGDGPPSTAAIEELVKKGRVDEALDGWAARYLAVKDPGAREEALRRHVELASQHAASPAEAWLVGAVRDADGDWTVCAGRRVVLVVSTASLDGVAPQRLAALADGFSLVVERLSGERPVPPPAPAAAPGQAAPPPPDRWERPVLGAGVRVDPAKARVDDFLAAHPGNPAKGEALVLGSAVALLRRVRGGLPNQRVSQLEPGLSWTVAALASREMANGAAMQLWSDIATQARKEYDDRWGSALLPDDALEGDALLHLFSSTMLSEPDPAAAVAAILKLPRETVRSRAIARSHDSLVEMLGNSLSPGAYFRLAAAGWMPAAAELPDAAARVAAESEREEALALRNDGATGAATGKLRAAADEIGSGTCAEQLRLDALDSLARDELKSARGGMKDIALIEGFEFIGPLPGTMDATLGPTTSHLLAVGVMHALESRPLKLTEPSKTTYKWEEPRETGWSPLLARTPWGDRRGTSWSSACVASVKLPKRIDAWIRVRPVTGSWERPRLHVDGVPVDPLPDGSCVVPGEKGTVLTLSHDTSINCALLLDTAPVADALGRRLNGEDPLLLLRTWASRRAPMATPAAVRLVTTAEGPPRTAALGLLGPAAGGDAAQVEAVLGAVGDDPAALVAFVRLCRGNRDPQAVDRLVELATADKAPADLVDAVRGVLECALFRHVPADPPGMAALWARGRKWVESTVFAEFETARDPGMDRPGFRAEGDPLASAGGCLGGHGWIYPGCAALLRVPRDVPGAAKTVSVRYLSTPGPLHVKGEVTNGRKTAEFEWKAPVTEPGRWTVATFPLPAGIKDAVAFVLDTPCRDYRLDALAVGAAPLGD